MSQTEKQSVPFKFIQLNFWTGRLYYPICAFLEREKPDIFAAQEVYTGLGNSKPDHMTMDMMLDESHGYFDDYATGGFGKIYTTNRGQERKQCCVIMTHKPQAEIVKRSYLSIENETETAFSDKAIAGDYHSLVHTQIKLEDGTLIHVLNYHGRVVFDGRMGGAVNDQDFKKVSEYIAQLSGPIVFSGDFNLYRGASSFKPLEEMGLINLNDVYDIQSARNEFSWKPEEVVSHVFVNDKIAVDSYRVPTDNVSDHLPLVMVARARI